MKKENTEKLLKDFPKLYRQHSLPMTETCMCWGFDCGDGWFDVIYDLSKEITKIDPNVEAVQVKEKFGGLRFYIGGVSNKTHDAVYEAVYKAEERAERTCEVCGKPGKITGTFWLKALCKECNKKEVTK